MNIPNSKCVIIIDCSLPCGIIANTAAILGISLGATMPQLVGCEIVDADGIHHAGITRCPIPVLGTNADTIKAIRNKLTEPPYSSLITIDFSDLAQGCKTYEEFITKMALCSETSLAYLGIVLCGDKKMIDKLTGSLPLLKA